MKKSPSLWMALLPVALLIFLLSLNVILYGDDATSGANQTALLLSGTFAAILSVFLGVKWKDIRVSIIRGISNTMQSIIILLFIGALAGTWLLSGVIPVMVYYGLQILHPKIFLFATVIICAIVSISTGSSWSTVATMGIALLGVGRTLGFNEALVAGAIISGAYFGDKMSPLSDTTNLAPAMAGTDLFTHIRYMTITTIPSIVITLVIFLIIGFSSTHEYSQESIQSTLDGLNAIFNINLLLLLVPAILIYIILKKMPPIPAIFIGALVGAVFAIIFQPELIKTLIEGDFSYTKKAYLAVLQSMFGDLNIHSDNETIKELLSTSGMKGMLNTIWLILSALIFSGVMEEAGFLRRIAEGILKFAHSTGSLIASTVSTCIFFNLTASEQYLSIVIPGQMFKDMYKQRGLKPEVLSRTLEDSGTITSPLIPWNTCGAYQSSVLGVGCFSYAPYAFFNIINPVMAIIIGYLNIKIRRYTPEEIEQMKLEEVKINNDK